MCFNPRSREGSDFAIQCRATYDNSFNPRSREGSDWLAAGYKNPNSSFNPRSREGSDACMERRGLLLAVSIHAPAKGATEIDLSRR